MADKIEVKAIIRSLIISCTRGMTIRDLNRDYRNEVGEYIPFSKLGHSSLENFLNSIPDVVEVRGHGSNAEVFAILSDKSKHINDMVCKQKNISQSRRSTVKEIRSNQQLPPNLHTASRYIRKQTNPNVGIFGPPPVISNFAPQSSFQHHQLIQSFPYNHTLYNVINPYNNFMQQQPYSNYRNTSYSDVYNIQQNSMLKQFNYPGFNGNYGYENPNISRNLTNISRQNTSNLLNEEKHINTNSSNKNINKFESRSDPKFKEIENCEELTDLFKKFQINDKKQESKITENCDTLNNLSIQRSSSSQSLTKTSFSNKIQINIKTTAEDIQNINKKKIELEENKIPKSCEKNTELDMCKAIPDSIQFDNMEFLYFPSGVAKSSDKILPSKIPEIITNCDFFPLFIVQVQNPYKFWFHFLDLEKGNDIDDLMHRIENVYSEFNENDLKMKESNMRPGQICCAAYGALKLWHRAEILENCGEKVKVNFIDFGTILNVSKNCIKYLLKEFCELPRQAHRGSVVGIEPWDIRWSREAIMYFIKRTNDIMLYAKPIEIDHEENIVRMLITDTTGKEDINLNDDMIKVGHARVSKYYEKILSEELEISSQERHYQEIYPTFDMLETGIYPTSQEISMYYSQGIDFENDVYLKCFSYINSVDTSTYTRKLLSNGCDSDDEDNYKSTSTQTKNNNFDNNDGKSVDMDDDNHDTFINEKCKIRNNDLKSKGELMNTIKIKSTIKNKSTQYEEQPSITQSSVKTTLENTSVNTSINQLESQQNYNFENILDLPENNSILRPSKIIQNAYSIQNTPIDNNTTLYYPNQRFNDNPNFFKYGALKTLPLPSIPLPPPGFEQIINHDINKNSKFFFNLNS